MTSPILHHYDMSPFSEKMRLVFGAKGVAWRSVIVPNMMPKPDAVALTGGYRRTPFLQIGADIYCDTALMCRVADALAPEPALYPPGVGGLADIVAQWADTAFFWVAVPFTIQPVSVPYMFPGATGEMLGAFMKDRAAMTPHMTRPSIADGGAQVRTYLARLESMLSGGAAFLLGDAVCIADFSAVHVIWFMRRSPPIGAMLDAYPRLLAWYERMMAFGHGVRHDMTSAEALEIARGAGGFAAVSVADGSGFAAGDGVTVTPTDYAHDAVAGALVGLSDASVVIAREDARAGVVHVHFPRVGFAVAKAG
jgi:glutathione S-transferase